MSVSTAGTKRSLNLEYLARVEGETALHVTIEGDRVTDVRLQIYEPPRLFEAFLRGRDAGEVPDLTARICGICPVAYQTSGAKAVEQAAGVSVGERVRSLRRLFYCGEWINSHFLHIYFLHAPDFLGCESAIELAQQQREIVERGLQLKKIGNELMTVIGGREIHSINFRVGGFYNAPSRSELGRLTSRLQWARDAAVQTVRWVAAFDFPEDELDYELVSLGGIDEYPIDDGEVVTSSGERWPVERFGEQIVEEQVPHSTALHGRLRHGSRHLVGPLARYSLNFDRLSPLAKQAAREAGLGPVCRNPYQSIIVRAVEALYAIEEALRLIEQYEPPEPPFVSVQVREATGHGASEAPRGLLYHRYRIDQAGLVQAATIIPPTSQNQDAIEEDLRRVVSRNLSLSSEELIARCAQVVRNHDPCISCATHALRVHLERR